MAQSAQNEGEALQGIPLYTQESTTHLGLTALLESSVFWPPLLFIHSPNTTPYYPSPMNQYNAAQSKGGFFGIYGNTLIHLASLQRGHCTIYYL